MQRRFEAVLKYEAAELKKFKIRICDILFDRFQSKYKGLCKHLDQIFYRRFLQIQQAERVLLSNGFTLSSRQPYPNGGSLLTKTFTESHFSFPALLMITPCLRTIISGLKLL